MSKRFPVDHLALRDRCIREGLIWGTNSYYEATPSAGATGGLMMLTNTLPLGQTAYVDHYTLSVSRACHIRHQWSPGGTGGNTNTIYVGASAWVMPDVEYYLPAGSILTIPIDAIMPAFS